MSRWAVFFDRDGVLTEVPEAGVAMGASALVVLDGARQAIGVVHGLGGVALVVTNQPDVARGVLDLKELAAMHERLAVELGVDAVRACPHDGVDRCRKPAPGMLVDLALELDVDLTRSYMIGDRWVDIAAGATAACTTILIERAYSWHPNSSGAPPSGLTPDYRATDVVDAVRTVTRLVWRNR
jgi:D-glycero-D-manno-heptose 1,7-bisphosphate phosphatase